MILGQITAGQDSVATEIAGSESVRILDLLLQGGFMMIPILILSVMAVYIFVERVLTINKAAKQATMIG